MFIYLTSFHHAYLRLHVPYFLFFKAALRLDWLGFNTIHTCLLPIVQHIQDPTP